MIIDASMCAVDAWRPMLCTPTIVTVPVCFAPTGTQTCPLSGFQRTTIDAECESVVEQFDSAMIALPLPLLDLAPCPILVRVCGGAPPGAATAEACTPIPPVGVIATWG